MAGRTHPPAHSRFQKGKSGNPKGRPRKAVQPQSSAFDIIIERTLTINKDGRLREVTLEEALEHRTYHDAIAGNRVARREILRMIARREQAITAKAPRCNPVEVKSEYTDSDSVNLALEILDIAHLDPRYAEERSDYVHMLLEPWAVEAALRRRGALRLRQQKIDDARRSTRDQDSIDWPEAHRE